MSRHLRFHCFAVIAVLGALLWPTALADPPAAAEKPADKKAADKKADKTQFVRLVKDAKDRPASLDVAIWDQVGSDLAASERLSLPIAFGIMLLAFAALIAAAIPVLLAFSSVMAALGIYAAISYWVPDGGSVANVVLLLGMAVGVDYSLFYLKREREERRKGRSTLEAREAASPTDCIADTPRGLTAPAPRDLLAAPHRHPEKVPRCPPPTALPQPPRRCATAPSTPPSRRWPASPAATSSSSNASPARRR